MRKNHWILAATFGLACLSAAVGNAQCNSCQTGAFSGNGAWPSTGSNGPFAQQRADYRAWRAEYKEKAAVTTNRNEAWPKPFACQDRMSYFSTIAMMYDLGWIAQCCLTSVHFDESGNLNEAGQNKVQAIMNNNPLDRRFVYILHSLNVVDTQTRLENVRVAVGNWYGPDLARNVQITDRIPQEISGQRIERINTLYQSGMQPPILPAGNVGAGGAGAGGTGTGTGGN